MSDLINFTLECVFEEDDDMEYSIAQLKDIGVNKSEHYTIVSEGVNNNIEFIFTVEDRAKACEIIDIMYGPEEDRDSNAFYLGEMH